MDDTVGITLVRGAQSMAFFAFIFSAAFALFNSLFADTKLLASYTRLRPLIRVIVFIGLFLLIMKSSWVHNQLSNFLGWITTENYPPPSGQETANASHVDNAKATAETVKNWVEAFAWSCAGVFFVYKAFSGYLITNLSLSVTCHRERSGQVAGTDYLVVVANVKKGDRGAVSLHEVRADVSPVADEKTHKPLAATGRLTSYIHDDGVFQLKKSRASKTPLLNLPPGEETMFAQWFTVPSDQPCTVEVTVLGGWRWHRDTRYQWRASTVSLPVGANTSKDN